METWLLVVAPSLRIVGIKLPRVALRSNEYCSIIIDIQTSSCYPAA